MKESLKVSDSLRPSSMSNLKQQNKTETKGDQNKRTRIETWEEDFVEEKD